jgi:hypothetical protein
MVMTSWSTSGAYSSVFETDENITDLYAIRHVYPISGFNMLLAAYIEGIKSPRPLDIDKFVSDYCKKQYGFTQQQSVLFYKALKTAPYQITQGTVVSPKPISINQVLDSTVQAAKILNSLNPLINQQEFEQYRLMTDIRIHYLGYEKIEKIANSASFDPKQIPATLTQLKALMLAGNEIDKRFITLNQNYLYPAELAQENELRDVKVRLLYQRLSRKR